jgi:hypothetical protein
MSEETHSHNRDRIEAVSWFLLAAATLASAWCASQSSLWNGEQARALARATTAQFHSARKAQSANRNSMIDVGLFIQYVEAELHGDTKVAAFLREHARPEMKPALEAWIADKEAGRPQLDNPFTRPQYKVEDAAAATALEERAAAEHKLANEANRNSDAFMLHTVLFALALFFLGATGQARRASLRKSLLGMGALAFALTVASMVRLPRAQPWRPGDHNPDEDVLPVPERLPGGPSAQG